MIFGLWAFAAHLHFGMCGLPSLVHTNSATWTIDYTTLLHGDDLAAKQNAVKNMNMNMTHTRGR